MSKNPDESLTNACKTNSIRIILYYYDPNNTISIELHLGNDKKNYSNQYSNVGARPRKEKNKSNKKLILEWMN